jgi:hypothetical protein
MVQIESGRATGKDPKSRDAFFGSKEKKQSTFFQPKRAVGLVDDVYEREADTVAERVTRSEHATPALQQKSMPIVQRQCAACHEEEKVQRKEGRDGEGAADGSFENYVSGLSGTGQPLPNDVRNYYEPRFGYDFSQVKIHRDTVAAKSAQSINARAYTTGNNIVFNSGQYAPHTGEGRRLLGHELTHVVQQKKMGDTVQRDTTTEVTVANTPGACSLDQHHAIVPAVQTASGWLMTAIRGLDGFIRNPAAQPGIQTSLQRHFRSSSEETARRVLGILRRILSNMTTNPNMTTECHTATDTSCGAAGAYVTGNLFVFCPSFFTGSSTWQAAAVIHEMAHSLTGNTHITDRAYLSDRMYDRLTTDEALTNADSYENFTHEVGTGVAFTTTAPVDAMNDCQDRQSVPARRALASIERWNRNAQVMTSDARPNMLSQWQDLQTTHLGGTTAAQIAAAKSAYDGVYNRLRSALTFECERSCDAGVGGYYRYFLFITAETLHLCPALFALNEDPRILTIYELILMRYGGVDEARAQSLARLAQALNARFWPGPGVLTGF